MAENICVWGFCIPIISGVITTVTLLITSFWTHLVPNFLGAWRSGTSPQPENSPRGSGIGRSWLMDKLWAQLGVFFFPFFCFKLFGAEKLPFDLDVSKI